jgi:hypothetical protein
VVEGVAVPEEVVNALLTDAKQLHDFVDCAPSFETLDPAITLDDLEVTSLDRLLRRWHGRSFPVDEPLRVCLWFDASPENLPDRLADAQHEQQTSGQRSKKRRQSDEQDNADHNHEN